VPGYRSNRTDREAVVAAEHDRQAPGLEFLMNSRIDGRIPGYHLIQVAIAVLGRQPRIEGALQIAAIDHLESAALQFLCQVGHPQRLRSHRGTAMARADVGRHADQ
jgi:hypothetical protein